MAVSELHAKNIAHLDLKPENILIDPDTLKITLIDFGFSEIGLTGRQKKESGTEAYKPDRHTAEAVIRNTKEHLDIYAMVQLLYPEVNAHPYVKNASVFYDVKSAIQIKNIPAHKADKQTEIASSSDDQSITPEGNSSDDEDSIDFESLRFGNVKDIPASAAAVGIRLIELNHGLALTDYASRKKSPRRNYELLSRYEKELSDAVKENKTITKTITEKSVLNLLSDKPTAAEMVGRVKLAVEQYQLRFQYVDSKYNNPFMLFRMPSSDSKKIVARLEEILASKATDDNKLERIGAVFLNYQPGKALSMALQDADFSPEKLVDDFVEKGKLPKNKEIYQVAVKMMSLYSSTMNRAFKDLSRSEKELLYKMADEIYSGKNNDKISKKFQGWKKTIEDEESKSDAVVPHQKEIDENDENETDENPVLTPNEYAVLKKEPNNVKKSVKFKQNVVEEEVPFDVTRYPKVDLLNFFSQIGNLEKINPTVSIMSGFSP